MQNHQTTLSNQILEHSRHKATYLIPWVRNQGKSILGQFGEIQGALLHTHTSWMKVDELIHFGLLFLLRKEVINKIPSKHLRSDRTLSQVLIVSPLGVPCFIYILELIGWYLGLFIQSQPHRIKTLVDPSIKF